MTNCECFTLDVSIQKKEPFIEIDKQSIFNYPKRKFWNMFHPAIMRADPFLFVHNERLFLFYEEMLLGKGLGYINMISTADLKKWTKPTCVIHEPQSHFSYPFVFKENDNVFIMPETGGDHNIRLYKAENEYLTKFKLHNTVLNRYALPNNIRFDFADSCIYKKNDVYYLFTSYCDDKTYYLQLFISNYFDKGYKEHPNSPIAISNKYGRCAGSIIEVNKHIYRPAQDCENVYGGQIHLMEIDELSPTAYKEHVVKHNIIPQQLKFYKEGGHHINFAKFKGNTIIATDARFTTSFLFERIRLKFLKIIHFK